MESAYPHKCGNSLPSIFLFINTNSVVKIITTRRKRACGISTREQAIYGAAHESVRHNFHNYEAQLHGLVVQHVEPARGLNAPLAPNPRTALHERELRAAAAGHDESAQRGPKAPPRVPMEPRARVVAQAQYGPLMRDDSQYVTWEHLQGLYARGEVHLALLNKIFLAEEALDPSTSGL